jgi:D-tyrosyl-tRNA(Tyr) deacylase
MRAVIQRVNSGSVTVDGNIVGSIGKGFVVLLGVSEKDTAEDVLYMTDKIVNLRIFEDSDEKMNLSLKDVKGELLVVSQFTLYGDCRKGRRPNFMSAARPEKAEELYNELVKKCRDMGIERVLITCAKDNIASSKTIMSNGGVLHSEDIQDGEQFQRYWIELVTE